MTTACSLHFMLRFMLGVAHSFYKKYATGVLFWQLRKFSHKNLFVERHLFHSVERNIFLFESMSAASP